MNWLGRLLTRLLPLEEINGNRRCPTYLYRWRLLRFFGCALYLHRFVGDDWSLDHHNHPKRFVTLMLWGRYTEHVLRPAPRTRSGYDEFSAREYAAPWLRSFPPSHAHRITLRPGEECWTLVFVYHAVRPWGFWHLGLWIPWKEYVRGKFSYIADTMTACQSIGAGR